jgi:glucans biosynthesis protein C
MQTAFVEQEYRDADTKQNPYAAPTSGTEASSESTTTSQRIHYLDNVRAIAMMLGLLMHGGLAYAESTHVIWIVGDRSGSVGIDIIVWFVHLFRMALFFLIAGYFAKLLVDKRGTTGFIKNRVYRVVLPFIVFWPLTTAAIVGAMIFGANYVQELPKILGTIKNPPPGSQAPPPTTGHLWFLYYLAMFAAITAILSWFSSTNLTSMIDTIYRKPIAWLFLPLLLVPAVVVAGTPLVSPETFTPTWWPFLFYGGFYLGGWHLFGREEALDKCGKYVVWMLLLSIGLFIPYYRLLPFEYAMTIAPQWLTLTESVLTSYLAVLLTIVALCLGKRFLSKQSPIMKFIAESSYWTYLAHLPIILFIQVLMVDWHVNVWIKFVLAMVSTFVLCQITYLAFVRYTPIGWMLNGRKRKSTAQA